MANGSGDKAAELALRVVAGAQSLVDDGWIWDSPEAKQAKVQSWRNKTGDLMAAAGIRRLQAACLHAISGDHFYVERRRFTTCDADWFQNLLERFVGKDRTARTGKGARVEWAAVMAVILGLAAHGDEHRIGNPKVSVALKVCLASGSVERLSAWAEQLGDDDLAEVAYSTYLWLPSLLLSMASQASVFGAWKDERTPSYYMWTAGPIVVPQVMSLGMRWYDSKYEFDYADDMEFWDDEANQLGELVLHRVGFDDEEVAQLIEDDEETWSSFRESETATHVSELVKLTSAEMGGAIALAALDITWETAVDPNVLPSEDMAALYPNRFSVDLVNAEQKLQVNLREVWWDSELSGQDGRDDDVALRLLGLAIGKQLSEWMKESMALRVKPGVPVKVHITPEPGSSEWDQLLWTLADQIPRDDLWAGSPDSPCLNIDVKRVGARSNEPAYPALGTVLLDGADGKTWKRIREAAYFVGEYGKARRPTVICVTGGVGYMYAGFNGATYPIELRDEIASAAIRRKFAASQRLLCSKTTMDAITAVAAKAGKTDHDVAVMFAWGFFSMDCVFDGYVWQDDAAWYDVYLDEGNQGVCSLVVREDERRRLVDGEGRASEDYVELFWSHAFPKQLREVVSPRDW